MLPVKPLWPKWTKTTMTKLLRYISLLFYSIITIVIFSLFLFSSSSTIFLSFLFPLLILSHPLLLSFPDWCESADLTSRCRASAHTGWRLPAVPCTAHSGSHACTGCSWGRCRSTPQQTPRWWELIIIINNTGNKGNICIFIYVYYSLQQWWSCAIWGFVWVF